MRAPSQLRAAFPYNTPLARHPGPWKAAAFCCNTYTKYVLRMHPAQPAAVDSESDVNTAG